MEEAYRLLKKSVIHVQAEDVTLEEEDEDEDEEVRVRGGYLFCVVYVYRVVGGEKTDLVGGGCC